MHTRIKELRKNAKLNQTEFAQKIDLKQTSYSAIERGIVNITDRVVHEICRVFHVNEEWLRYGTGEKFIQLSEEEELTEWVKKILSDKSAEASQARALVHGVKTMYEDGSLPILMNSIDKLVKLIDLSKKGISTSSTIS